MTLLTRLFRRARHRDRSLGQSVVELALLAPVVLLILMVGLDFGRVYLGWVNLNNTARIAANFAATNATALTGTGPIHDSAVDRYEALILADATTINCELTDPIALPTYVDQNGNGSAIDLNDIAHVAIDCDFGIITPIISNILGTPIKVSASSDFPIRNGVVAGVPAGGGGAVTAAFNISPVSGTGSAATPLTVTYTDASSGSPTSYFWDLNGDGVIDSNQVGGTLTHDFTIPGTYTAKLTVSNGTSTHFTTRTITVNPPPGPIVSFVSNPVGGTAPLSVSFTNNSSGVNPLTYEWDFESDGTVDATTKDASHTYNTDGTFTVTLTVTDSDGLSNSGTATISVTPAVPQCVVPNFTNMNQQTSDPIQQKWTNAGFTTTVIFNPIPPPDYKIKTQNPAAGTSQPCATTVLTVAK